MKVIPQTGAGGLLLGIGGDESLGGLGFCCTRRLSGDPCKAAPLLIKMTMLPGSFGLSIASRTHSNAIQPAVCQLTENVSPCVVLQRT